MKAFTTSSTHFSGRSDDNRVGDETAGQPDRCHVMCGCRLFCFCLLWKSLGDLTREFYPINSTDQNKMIDRSSIVEK